MKWRQNIFKRKKIYKTCKLFLKWKKSGISRKRVRKLLTKSVKDAWESYFKHKTKKPNTKKSNPAQKNQKSSVQRAARVWEQTCVFASLAPCWGFPDRKQWFSRPRPPSRLPGWRQSRSYKYPPHVLRVEECVCFKWNASSMENTHTYTRAHTFTITQAKTVFCLHHCFHASVQDLQRKHTHRRTQWQACNHPANIHSDKVPP